MRWFWAPDAPVGSEGAVGLARWPSPAIALSTWAPRAWHRYCCDPAFKRRTLVTRAHCVRREDAVAYTGQHHHLGAQAPGRDPAAGAVEYEGGRAIRRAVRCRPSRAHVRPSRARGSAQFPSLDTDERTPGCTAVPKAARFGHLTMSRRALGCGSGWRRCRPIRRAHPQLANPPGHPCPSCQPVRQLTQPSP